MYDQNQTVMFIFNINLFLQFDKKKQKMLIFLEANDSLKASLSVTQSLTWSLGLFTVSKVNKFLV